MNDWMLIREFLDRHSESAFSELVNRHVGLVYGVALRELGDADAAKDVTQAVFILLAEKSPGFGASVIVPGWLHRTALFVARRARRDQRLRARLETEAMQQLPDTSDPEGETWSGLAPHLDGALEELGATDRNAIILRYLERKSFQEVGSTMGLSEDAAKKRVARAMDRLRDRFQRRGVTVASGIMGAVLSLRAAVSPPDGLAESVLRAGLSGGTLAEPGARALIRGQPEAPPTHGVPWGWIISVGVAVLVLTVGTIWRSRSRSGPESKTPAPAAAALVEETIESPVASNPSPTSTRVRVMRLQVIAQESRQPLPGARVKTRFFGNGSMTVETVTDSDGWVELILPEDGFEGMTVAAHAPGRVPRMTLWQPHEEPNLPTDYVLSLPVGISLSGLVLDPQGLPVENARLTFNGSGLDGKGREEVWYGDPAPALRTDATGRWSMDFLDPTARALGGRIEHSAFAPTEVLGSVEAQTNWVFQFQPGFTVAGAVTDSNGGAVVYAQVNLESDGNLPQRSAHADSSGHFEFQRIAPGEYRLTTQTPGAFPTTTPVFLKDRTVTQDLVVQRLPSAGNAVLKGRVLSSTGARVHDARVTFKGGPSGDKNLAWSLPLGTDGRWEWRNAPNQAVELEFHSSNHESRTAILSPDPEEQPVVMKATPTVLLRGTVTASRDGRPIPNFKVMRPDESLPFLGEGREGAFAFRMPPDSFKSNAGRYRPGHPKYGLGLHLLFVADGFAERDIVVPEFPGAEGILNITLDPMTQVERSILQPDLQPASGAWVSYRGPNLGLPLTSPGYFGMRDHPDTRPGRVKVETDPDGRFSLIRVDRATRLAVVHESGWANVPIESDGSEPIVLQPWGRVEGVFRLGGSPIPNATILLASGTHAPEQILFTNFRAKTDANGQFVFQKVPGGLARAHHYIESGNTALGGHSAEVTVHAGKISTITLGGSGTRLTGWIRTPSAAGSIDWNRSWVQLTRQEATAAPFGGSPLPDSYGAICESGGRFVIEDVPAGKYQLQIGVAPPRPEGPPSTLSEVEAEEAKVLRESRDILIPSDLADGSTVDLGDVWVQGKANGASSE